MTALMFGPSDAPLFGVFHPSTAQMRAKRAVLLCNPFGEEAIRAFRPFKRLAESLAADGIPSFRFDYHGTGDSAGADDELTLEGMTQSLLAAHEELQDLCEAREIYWVGLRLGAWPVLAAAQDARPAGVILWEAVADGPAYLEELKAMPSHADEALGFPIPPALAEGLRAGLPAAPEGVPVKLIGCDELFGQRPLIPPRAEEWNSDDALNSFTMPVETLGLIQREIAAW
ncbi:hypothetical protein [Parvularcula marina]|uniref:hypothetical protein n=1 Tax=Parvularcula marina TaxID=2292771 RepID=UPI0013148111|nr:hypothetical protein [Parvularcula marina]